MFYIYKPNYLDFDNISPKHCTMFVGSSVCADSKCVLDMFSAIQAITEK